MRREISTPYSFAEKVVYQIALFCILLLFNSRQSTFTTFSSISFAAVITVCGVVVIRRRFTYKKIEMDENGLFISQKTTGQDKEIFIPFNEIAQIQEISSIQSRNEFYAIKFKIFTRFGDEIKFIPKSKFMEYPKNAVITELEEQISKIKSLPITRMPTP